MTELQLYKFVNKNCIQTDWRGEELIVWLPFHCLEEFVELVGKEQFFDYGGIDAKFQEDSIVFDIAPICENYDIDPENILEK
jgi:hypothetical protein